MKSIDSGKECRGGTDELAEKTESGAFSRAVRDLFWGSPQ